MVCSTRGPCGAEHRESDARIGGIHPEGGHGPALADAPLGLPVASAIGGDDDAAVRHAGIDVRFADGERGDGRAAGVAQKLAIHQFTGGFGVKRGPPGLTFARLPFHHHGAGQLDLGALRTFGKASDAGRGKIRKALIETAPGPAAVQGTKDSGRSGHHNFVLIGGRDSQIAEAVPDNRQPVERRQVLPVLAAVVGAVHEPAESIHPRTRARRIANLRAIFGKRDRPALRHGRDDGVGRSSRPSIEVIGFKQLTR